MLLPSLVFACLGAAPLTDVVATGAYRYTFDGTFWNGQRRSVAANETLAREGFSISLKVTPDGEVVRDAKPAERTPYNDVAAILSGGGNTPKAGASWKATLSPQTGESSEDTTPVTLDVRVARTDADGTLVQATGTTHAISTSGGYHSPIDVTVRVASLVRDGALVRFEEDVTDYVHAGPLSQEMHWHWSLVARSD